MKRILGIILSLVIVLFSLSGCSDKNGKASNTSEKEEISIVTTVFPPYDFARQIAKDNCSVKMILPPGGECHSYEPTLDDIAAIQGCDIFIYTGGDSDSWCQKILSNTDTRDIRIISMLSAVTPLYTEDEHDHTHEEEKPDEHIWTSPKNAVKVVKAINSALIEADAEHEIEYNKNTVEYISQLETLDKEYKDCVDSSKRNTLVFADRFPFLYLTEEYGLEHFEALDGCTSDTEPTLTAINRLVEVVKNENIPMVFYIDSSDGSVADKVCSLTGAEKTMLHSCHSVSEEELESGETYLSLMNENLEKIRKALN